MIVRCGNCRTQFDVPGEGRFSCPVCGSVNMVRARPGEPAPAGAPPPGSMPPGSMPPGSMPPGSMPPGSMPPGAPPPQPPPDVPMPRVECPECGFSFIVGDIAVATCPNCASDVPTGLGSPEPLPPVAGPTPPGDEEE